MSNFLFPANDSVDHAKRKYAYPALLGDIVRGSRDSIDALRLFQELLRGNETSSSSIGFMAFDAHGGDTGCHLRAGMFLETFKVYRDMFLLDSDGWQDFERSVENLVQRLQEVSARAQEACARLTKEKVKPGKVGFHANQETPRNFLVKLGWTGQVQSKSLASGLSSEASSFSDKNLSSSSDEDLKDDVGAKNPTWNVLHFSTLVRFVIYSFILSRHKTFSYHKEVLIGRLDLPEVDKITKELMEPYWDMQYSAYKHPGPKRLDREFSDIQSWLSKLSCEWLSSLADRLSVPTGASGLMARTLQKSPKGLTAAACYPGFLVQRTTFSHLKSPILLVDRYFCSHGYHVNVFEAEVSQARKRRSFDLIKELLLQCLPRSQRHKGDSLLQQARPWKVSRTSIEALTSGEDQISPHFLVMGNSFNGSHDSYTSLAVSAKQDSERTPQTLPHSLCTGQSCEENERHVQSFVEADHDQVALSTFAIHPSYPFPISSATEEVTFVEDCLETWGRENGHTEDAQDMIETWRSTRRNADRLGCGKGDMRLFAWQHVCLETKGRLGRMLEQSVKEADLMPLQASVAELSKRE
ncbi:hypothetical protein QQZ08_005028 [Neonectria magnoliae]|uniref:Uncharacterized protein n=1 Tax=Neonectria magnoliae TaxID=2732573 RepID=A0ABR1I4E0_9HYPO